MEMRILKICFRSFVLQICCKLAFCNVSNQKFKVGSNMTSCFIGIWKVFLLKIYETVVEYVP